MKNKRLICEACGAVQFEIIVEPTLPETEEQKSWLRDAIYCPHCGSECE